MHPIITAELMRDHREDLLRQAEAAQLAYAARRYRDREPDPVRSHRAITFAVVVVRGWLARGVL